MSLWLFFAMRMMKTEENVMPIKTDAGTWIIITSFWCGCGGRVLLLKSLGNGKLFAWFPENLLHLPSATLVGWCEITCTNQCCWVMSPIKISVWVEGHLYISRFNGPKKRNSFYKLSLHKLFHEYKLHLILDPCVLCRYLKPVIRPLRWELIFKIYTSRPYASFYV